jgi:DNA-binding response OmpR family regulator
MRVLLVEGHEPRARALGQPLAEVGFAVDLARDARQADAKARKAAYDAIVLDLTLPRLGGLGLLRGWRSDDVQTHVLALTGAAAGDRIRGLDAGADDCLSRPFELGELVARLRALIRRQYRVKDPVLRAHDLEIHTPSRAVRRAGQAIQLTPLEYALLEFLAFHRGRVASRTAIREHLYGEQGPGLSNLMDVYIRRLRRKIDRGFHPPLVLTRWGEGYFLRADE